jgi:hypothetical protein
MLKKSLHFLGKKILESRLLVFTLYILSQICLLELVDLRYPCYVGVLLHTDFVFFNIALLLLCFKIKLVREDE